jgi:hypothetical protein
MALDEDFDDEDFDEDDEDDDGPGGSKARPCFGECCSAVLACGYGRASWMPSCMCLLACSSGCASWWPLI